MIDIEYEHPPFTFVDSIAHPILAAPSTPLTLEGGLQRRSHDPRPVSEGTADELPCGECSTGGEAVRQCSTRTGSEDYREGLVAVVVTCHDALVHGVAP